MAAKQNKPPYSKEYEQRIGAEAAAEVEKQYERYEDEEAQARLTEIVTEIAKVSGRPDVEYDIRLLDTEAVNGFSLPGGIIYVTKGLLGAVQSDHELAGVLAHEIAHNCTYDALLQADRNKELFTGSLAAAIAAILAGGDSEMVSTVLVTAELIGRGVLNHYSIGMERAADAHAVEFLLKTAYDPVGLLTFMERLAAKEGRQPQLERGVDKTHPLAAERVQALADQIYEAGRDINRRATTEWERPVAEEVEGESEGEKYVRVALWGKEIFRVLTPGPEHDSPMARAEAIAARLTEALKAGMRKHDVSVTTAGETVQVIGRGVTILTVQPADAEAQSTEVQAVADQVCAALHHALFEEKLDRL
ncbi:MAG: M48 family metalloprotease [Armatimonadota bacterium]|nr:M48 family metalloprotease [Armatimonadota bacterium]